AGDGRGDWRRQSRRRAHRKRVLEAPAGSLMKIRLYLDEDAMDGNLVWALRIRGLDVVTALDSGLIHAPDAKHLEYASLDGRTLYSFNVGDYMALHTAYLTAGQTHAGLILSHQQR